jgi:cell division protease FtsH
MIYGPLIVMIFVWSWLGRSSSPLKSSWNDVEKMIVAGDVARIDVVNEKQAEVYLKPESVAKYRAQEKYKRMPESDYQFVFNVGSVEIFDRNMEKLCEQNPSLREIVAIDYPTRSNVWLDILGYLPILLLVLFMFFMMRAAMRGGAGGAGGGGQGIFNVGKAKAQVFDQNDKDRVTFKDVAGLEEAKVEIMEIVDFLRNPNKYKELGGKIPKGALLVGPPGTGKTLLAKAVAGEANVPFFSMSGSDFVEMFVGVGASRVRDLFRQAKEKAPCIVFIDEIDAVGRARVKNGGYSGNDERENTLNQLLTEMDGFGTNSGVIILAATNRADILDKALMRAGRFDRQIEVGLPDIKERGEIFDVHLRNIKLDPKLDRDFLARQTPGFSGADIANVCNEAALIAARNNKRLVDRDDFLSAIDRIVGGLERKSLVMTVQEKRITAYHEAGHAVVSWMLECANPLIKVTIIPRGRSLGATWFLPEERHTLSRTHLIHAMAVGLGGRIAEQIEFGIIDTGALSDLEGVTKRAYAMVAYYGMSEKVGNRSYYDSSGQSDMSFSKPYSEEMARLIDDEVNVLIKEAYALAEKTLKANIDGFRQLSEELLEKEVVFTDDLERIFGKSLYDQKKEADEAPAKGKKGAHRHASEEALPAADEPPSVAEGTTISPETAKDL